MPFPPLDNLMRRVATAVVALPLLLAAIHRGEALLTTGIVALALVVAYHEYARLLVAGGLVPFRLAGLVVGALAFLDISGWLPPVEAPWPVAALLLMGALPLRGDMKTALPSAGATLLGAVYLGGLGGCISALRTLPPATDGAWRLTLLLAIVMGSDTLAFAIGHALGRRRLAPSISPGKTVEGALGGLLGGAAGALLVRGFGLPGLPLAHALGLGIATAALGILGDLVESVLKRWAGAKDSGSLLPGHGGMLDRIDGLLFGAPVLYYYFLYAR